MTFPTDIGVIDLMLQIPGEDPREWYEFMQPLFMDDASRNYKKMPAEYIIVGSRKCSKKSLPRS